MTLSRMWIQLVFVIIGSVVISSQDVIRIGGLFDSGDDKQQMAFRYAVESINSDRNLLMHARLSAQSETLPPNDSFRGTRKACSLLKSGVAAIFGPQSPHTSAHVQSICDALEVPHIENRWDFRLKRDAYSVNVYPHPASLAKAYSDVLEALRWKRLCIIYESNNGLVRVQELLKNRNFKVKLLQLPNSQDFRPLLKDTKKSGNTHIVLDVETANIYKVLKQAQQVGLMTSYHNYFITSLDLHTIDLEDFRHGGTNITGLRLIDPESTLVQRVLSDWGFDPRHFGNVIDIKSEESTTPPSVYFSDISSKTSTANNISYGVSNIPSAFAAMASSQTVEKFFASSLTTEVALMFDAVHLFAKALHDLHRSSVIQTTHLDCDGDITWVHGTSIVNYMKWVEINGLTGLIRFDTEGFRKDFSLDIIELWKTGLTKVGRWDLQKGANYTRTYNEVQQGIVESLQNKTLMVYSILSPPYTMLRESSEQMSGNDRYEGFCVDLIEEISKILGFNYTIRITEDGNHGTYTEGTGKWNGMIGELLNRNADLAIGDLTITYEREQVVDFTMPWMNLGIGIIYTKPSKSPPDLFSFLSPLSLDVWLYMATAYLTISFLLFVLARFSPYEPKKGTPDTDESHGHNLTSGEDFSLSNCLWFCIGSLMQQGGDLLPRAVSTRIAAGMWWFFTLIMISSYTANLAAFLTVERMVSPIESAADLAKQTKIKYGSLWGGSTYTFFATSKVPTYQRMYNFMESQRPSVYTKSNEAGIERVSLSGGQYAFLMESSSIEYMTERLCHLTQIGGQLDSKSYGIALPQGSPYTNAISGAILTLQENAILQELKDRWWKERKGGGQCKDDESKSSSQANELGLANVGGVYVVLLAGMGIAAIVAIGEFVWYSRKLATAAHASVWTEMGRELKCVFSCHSNKKAIKKNNSFSQGEPDVNGPAYLPMETYGSNYTPSQYSFQSKEPGVPGMAEISADASKKYLVHQNFTPQPVSNVKIGGSGATHGMPHVRSLDRLSMSMRPNRRSIDSLACEGALQSPDLPFQLISGV